MRNNFEEQFGQVKAVESAHAPPQASNPYNMGGEALSFVVSTESVELPSGGRYYPPTHPLYMKSSVEIKHMTAKEEDILTNKSYIKKGVVIDKFVQSVLLDKSIDPASLIVGDKNAIMVAARISGYGAQYDVGILCDSCNTKNLVPVDLNACEVYNLEKIESVAGSDGELVYSRMDNGNVVIQVPKNKWYVECKILTGLDELKLLNILERKRKLDENAEITISEQLAVIINSINTVTDRNTVEQAIGCMPASDAKYLRKAYGKLMPSMKITSVFYCSACYSKQEVEVPFSQEFFWPK
jgi:hypothetical protein